MPHLYNTVSGRFILLSVQNLLNIQELNILFCILMFWHPASLFYFFHYCLQKVKRLCNTMLDENLYTKLIETKLWFPMDSILVQQKLNLKITNEGDIFIILWNLKVLLHIPAKSSDKLDQLKEEYLPILVLVNHQEQCLIQQQVHQGLLLCKIDFLTLKYCLLAIAILICLAMPANQ